MMRFYLLILVVFIAGCMTAPPQPIPVEEKVFEVPGVSQKDLFSRARVWFGDSFISPESVITFEDANAGEIRGRSDSQIVFSEESIKKMKTANVLMNLGGENPVYEPEYLKYSIQISVKEGKARMVLTNFTHTVERQFAEDVPIFAKTNANRLFVSFEKAIQSELASKDESW